MKVKSESEVAQSYPTFFFFKQIEEFYYDDILFKKAGDGSKRLLNDLHFTNFIVLL